MNTRKELQKLEKSLIGVIAAITQTSGKASRRATRVATITAGKVVGAASTGGILMFISSFGTASTGTAIATLSGAAASNATLFWIGSWFGTGVLGGAVAVFLMPIAIGFLVIRSLRKRVFGSPRETSKLEDFEAKTIYSASQMAGAIAPYLEDNGPEANRDELRILAREGILPLTELIDAHLAHDSRIQEEDTPCASFDANLARLPRRQLRLHHRRLCKQAQRLARKPLRSRLPGWLQWLLPSPFSA
ncbi:MAG: hypothetical protein K5863_00030 [Nitratireductor sp.]|uniref:hypothetical protein n=1 Tax=Nitratireductor sp. TaxID=1872084 RepID=UPI002601DBA0|nr:hypothetical protein [Nitratireductor sp.]MCV0348435.1 hypothetical protein [Nitratireductor sp.]